MYILKISLLIAIACSSFLTNTQAQNTGKISGKIISGNEKTLAGATVSLLRGKDSATIKLSAANKEGMFVSENVTDGKYLVSVTSVGYKRSYSSIIELNPL